MAKTRSQTGNKPVKKEEEEDCKSTLGLNGVRNTTSNSKITKRKAPKSNTSILPTQEIKVEEDTDTKSLLESTSKSSELPKGQRVSQEQINQLIDAIVNQNMSVNKAALKAKLSYTTGVHYYNVYKKNPEKKIPLPRNQCMHPKRYLTQQQIENLIRYINGDKMTIQAASAKANMNYQSGMHYYNRYLNDSNHNVSIPRLNQHYTQDQKNEFIGYVVNDKMSIPAASKQAKISVAIGRKHYRKYFNDQNPDIPTSSHIDAYKYYKQEQIKEVISYIMNDKMTIAAASRKANISFTTASKYYRRYLKDNNMELPAPKSSKCLTQDKINELIGYITGDKMTIKAASKKASIATSTGHKYCQQYLKENNIRPPSFKYTQDQKNEFIGYIVDDGMDMMAASKKANIHSASGKVYYLKYRKEHNIDTPALKYRKDKIKELAGYIIDDKMSVRAASKKVNISPITGTKYYRQYLKDQKRDASN